MKNLYDLEQKILSFSNILEDLDDVDNMNDVQVINSYYKHKFNVLWDTYTAACDEVFKQRNTPDQEHEDWVKYFDESSELPSDLEETDSHSYANNVVSIADDVHKDNILEELHEPDSPIADVLPPCDVEPRQEYP